MQPVQGQTCTQTARLRKSDRLLQKQRLLRTVEIQSLTDPFKWWRIIFDIKGLGKKQPFSHNISWNYKTKINNWGRTSNCWHFSDLISYLKCLRALNRTKAWKISYLNSQIDKNWIPRGKSHHSARVNYHNRTCSLQWVMILTFLYAFSLEFNFHRNFIMDLSFLNEYNKLKEDQPFLLDCGLFFAFLGFFCYGSSYLTSPSSE